MGTSSVFPGAIPGREPSCTVGAANGGFSRSLRLKSTFFTTALPRNSLAWAAWAFTLSVFSETIAPFRKLHSHGSHLSLWPTAAQGLAAIQNLMKSDAPALPEIGVQSLIHLTLHRSQSETLQTARPQAAKLTKAGVDRHRLLTRHRQLCQSRQSFFAPVPVDQLVQDFPRALLLHDATCF